MFLQKICNKIVFLSSFFLLVNIEFVLFVKAIANPNTEIPANIAKRHTSEIFIAPGRITVISFQDGEKITQIEPSDGHRIIYSTNSALEEGGATHIVITQIQQYAHPEATVNRVPNFIVFTTNAEDSYHAVYEFNINLDSAFNRGVTIIETPVDQKITWNTKFGKAHPQDIETGFKIALREKKITSDDAHHIRTFLALVRNGTSVNEAIAQTQVSIELIDILASIGLKHFHRHLSSGKLNIEHIHCDNNNCFQTPKIPNLKK